MGMTVGAVRGTVAARTRRVDVACFVQGTLIATPKGEKPIEYLRPGDLVLTRDNGVQDIRWIGSRHIGWQTLTANPHLKPVVIRWGALDWGSPAHDLYVSPNHRVLVRDENGEEVLAAAKQLIGNDGIEEVDAMGVTYFHLMFERHEVILSDGMWTESFQPSDYALGTVGNSARAEILALFPELRTEKGIATYTPARRIAVGAEMMRLR
jgi:hypothetical protein